MDEPKEPKKKRKSNLPPEGGPGRNRLPRVNVLEEFERLNFKPIEEMVNIYTLAGLPEDKRQVSLDALNLQWKVVKEAVAYVAAKKRMELGIKVGEDEENPLTGLLNAIAQNGRPKPKGEE